MKASLRCWFCDVTAFTKSLIRLDNLSQPVLRRESSGPPGSSLRALESELREQEERVARTGRERALHTGTLFLNSPIWPRPQAAAQISVRVGRSPACTAPFARHMITRHLIFNSTWKIYTGLYICCKHTLWCQSLTVINIICYLRCQLLLETKHRICHTHTHYPDYTV